MQQKMQEERLKKRQRNEPSLRSSAKERRCGRFLAQSRMDTERK
jgi:hypothetical protein